MFVLKKKSWHSQDKGNWHRSMPAGISTLTPWSPWMQLNAFNCTKKSPTFAFTCQLFYSELSAICSRDSFLIYLQTRGSVNTDPIYNIFMLVNWPFCKLSADAKRVFCQFCKKGAPLFCCRFTIFTVSCSAKNHSFLLGASKG